MLEIYLLMHAANVSILRQDQVIEYFSSVRFCRVCTIFLLLSYRQIVAHAEHEEGLKDIDLLGYHVTEVSIQPFRTNALPSIFRLSLLVTDCS